MTRARSGARLGAVLVSILTILMASVSWVGAQDLEPILPDHPLNILELVDLSLAFNPGLKGVEEQRVELAGGVKEAKAEAFPQLAFRGSWSQSRNPSLLNSADFEDIIEQFPGFSPSVQELYNGSIELNQAVFTWGKIPAAIALAKMLEKSTEAKIATAQLDTALATAEAYFGLLEAREGLETIEIQRESRQQSYAVVEARYELGDATRLELLQSQAALAELIPTIDLLEGLVEVNRIQLRAVLGLPGGVDVEVDDTEIELPDPQETERALAVAMAHRPEFLDLQYQGAALDEQRNVTRSDGRPQVDLNGFYGHTAREYGNLDDPLYSDWLVSLGLRWEFYSGGRRKGQIAQIDSRSRQVDWALAELRNQVERQVEQVLTEFRAALSGLAAAEISAEAATEASRVASENYEEGVALQIDLLAAQEREIQAEVTRVQAYFGARIRAARLLRALGLFPHEDWNTATTVATENMEKP